MKYAVKTTLAVVISSMLAACGGTKGSFGVDDVEVEKPGVTKGSSKDISTTPRVKAEEAEGIMRPALGYEVKIPVRNRHPKNKDVHVSLNTESIVALNQNNNDVPHLDEVKKSSDNAVVIYTHTNTGKASAERNTEYVKSGYVANIGWTDRRFREGIFKVGPYGYVYYHGTNPSTAVPATLKATYQGTWDFVTDAKDGRNFDGSGFNPGIYRPGDFAGASSFDDRVHNQKDGNKIGHTSEFDVDFGTKKLSGKLYKHTEVNNNNPEQAHLLRYTIAADIVGNRFKGKAIANDKNNEAFKQDSNYLEGGFYGPNSEELAGKFLANDYSLFAVFAGKRAKTEGEKVEKQYDAVYIPLDNFKAKDLNTFGNIDKLIIDGKEYDIATNKDTFVSYKTDKKDGTKIVICCSNLDYVKFGNIGVNNQANYFLQGERTATKEMPTSGEVNYKGTWEGYISDSAVWSTSAGNQNGGSRAEFEVDFGSKKIAGKLTAEERINPTFIIHGSLDGNGFNGKASTGKDGFNLDPAATNSSRIVHIQNVDVKGGFFGKDASELGGSFHSEASKVGVVFGAKRQANE